VPRVVSALPRRCGQQRFCTRTSDDVSQLSRLFAGLAYSATAIGSHLPSYTVCAALAHSYLKPIAIAKIQPGMQAEKKT
jgi:hypothetical protein